MNNENIDCKIFGKIHYSHITRLLVNSAALTGHKRIVRELQVQKCVFTYHIEGQFHFSFIFLYVGRIEISCGRCGLLQTRFFLNFPIKHYYCKKRGNFRFVYWKNNLCHQKVHKKLHITHYYGYFEFSNSC